MRTLVAALALLFSCAVQPQLPAGCSGDASLTGRTDVIWCEKFENSTWWEAVNGYTEDGGKTNPQPSSGPDRTQIISSGCVSGNCLQGNFPACVPDGESWSGVLGKNKVIPGNKDEIYRRYYIKLADSRSTLHVFRKPGSRAWSSRHNHPD